MKRALLFAVLCVTTLPSAPELEAQASACFDPAKCGVLPCEFMTELKVAKAEAALYHYAKVSEYSIENSIDGMMYTQRINDSLDKISQQYTCGPAAKRPSLKPVPPTCEVGVVDARNTFKPLSRGEALDTLGICSEVVEAAYSHASALRYACEQGQQRRSNRVSVDARNQQYLYAAELKVELLQKDLKRYLNSCTPDGKLSQELTDLGLDALKNEAQSVRERWEASRLKNSSSSPSVSVSPK
jgi:hypothetical protein